MEEMNQISQSGGEMAPVPITPEALLERYKAKVSELSHQLLMNETAVSTLQIEMARALGEIDRARNDTVHVQNTLKQQEEFAVQQQLKLDEYQRVYGKKALVDAGLVAPLDENDREWPGGVESDRSENDWNE